MLSILRRIEKASLEHYKRYKPEEVKALPRFSWSVAEDQYKIEHGGKAVVIDNERGLGQVPWNQEVRYKGFVGIMKPSSFIKLALPDKGTQDKTATEMVKLFQQGYGIGNPWLQIDIRETPYKIEGHEGRGRCKAVLQYLGDIPMPIHFFVYTGKNRDLKPETFEELHKGMLCPEDTNNPINVDLFQDIIHK